jgi:hypothetical protein
MVKGALDGAPGHITSPVLSPEPSLVHIRKGLTSSMLRLVPALRSAAQGLATINAGALLVLRVKVNVGQVQELDRRGQSLFDRIFPF